MPGRREATVPVVIVTFESECSLVDKPDVSPEMRRRTGIAVESSVAETAETAAFWSPKM
jgi:hypothetical protein